MQVSAKLLLIAVRRSVAVAMRGPCRESVCQMCLSAAVGSWPAAGNARSF